MSSGKSTRELTREFFRLFPDYQLSRTLAENVGDQVLTYPQALQQLARKRQAQSENWEVIEEKLEQRSVEQNERRLKLRDLTLRQILQLDDRAFEEVVRFYFKHPYAHRRTWRSRWAPRWLRSFFLRVLFGHAKGRNLSLDYPEYFEILRLL